MVVEGLHDSSIGRALPLRLRLGRHFEIPLFGCRPRDAPVAQLLLTNDPIAIRDDVAKEIESPPRKIKIAQAGCLCNARLDSAGDNS